MNSSLKTEKYSSAKEKMDGTIVRFYLYRFISRLSFYVPILVVYFLAMNMNITQIAVLISAYGFMTTMTSIPPVTNITKKISPKNMLMTGEILKGISVGLTYFSSNIARNNDAQFYILLIAQLIGGIGYSFAAGSDGSFLFKYCRDNDIKDYKTHEAKSSSTVFLSFLGAGVIGGFVSTVDVRLPFLLTLPAHIICAILVFTFKDLKSEGKNIEQAKEKTTVRKELINNVLVSHMLFYSVSRAIIMTLAVSIFPFYFFKTLNISVALFGIIFGSYTLTGFFVGKSTIKLREKFGEQKFSFILIGCVIITLILLCFVHSKIVIFAPLIIYIMTGAVRPHSMTRINVSIKEEKNRSTIIALTEGAFGLINVIMVLICFVILQTYDIYSVFKMLLILSTGLYSFLFVLSKGKI